MSLRSLVSALTLTFVPSCSFIGVRGPATPIPAGPVRCTDNSDLPTIDLIPAVVGTVAVIVGAIVRDEAKSDDLGAGIGGSILLDGGLIVGVPYGGSVIYGLYAVSRCRDAKKREQLAAKVRGTEELERNARRQRAWDVTKQAAAAARNADCGTVAVLAGQVRSIDVDF